MANNISVKIRADGLKEFDKIFSEYQKWNKRQGADIVNAKLYFIALNAMQTTKTADKTKIATELMAPAQKYPTVPLAAILVNKQLTAKNKKGLNGLKMTEAIKRYIKKSISRTQFLRSGWIPAIKKLDYWNKQGDISFVKRFSPKKPVGIKQYGKDKGTVVPARPVPRCSGTIINLVGQGKQSSPTVDKILNDGLVKAVKIEMASMLRYINRKYEEKLKKLNSQTTYK